MSDSEQDVVPLHAPFDTSVRGFHRRQVLDHVDALEARLEMVVADRDGALRQVAELTRVVDHLRGDATDARTRLDRLRNSPNAVAAVGERLQQMMALAEDETGELRLRAQRDADETRRAAAADAAHTRSVARRDAERVREESAAERARHEALIASEYAEHTDAVAAERAEHVERIATESAVHAERIATESAVHARRIDTESTEHAERIAAEQAEQRRAEQAAAEQRRVTISEGRAEAERLVAEARAECARLDAEAEAERLRLDAELIEELDTRHRESTAARRRADRLSTMRSTLLVEAVRVRLENLERRGREVESLHAGLLARLGSVRGALVDAEELMELPARGARGATRAAAQTEPPVAPRPTAPPARELAPRVASADVEPPSPRGGRSSVGV